MEVRLMEISRLIPADYNPRRDLQPEDEQYKKIKRSIEEFGYVEPVVWNQRTGLLVSGHQRLKILKEMGKSSIETVVVDLDPKEEKKLNVLINRAKGRWDNDKLSDLLRELDEAGGVELTGFDEWELQGIIDEYDKLADILDYEPQADDNSAEEEERKTFTLTIDLPPEYADPAERYIASMGEEIAYATLADEVVKLVEGVA